MPLSVTLSAEHRILLYLSSFSKHKEDYEAPYGVCQAGISRALDMKVNNVSRTLSILTSKGLVSVKLAHVKGSKRRLRVFFSTSSGEAQAAEIAKSLGKTKILLRNESGLKETSLAKAMEMLVAEGKKASTSDVVEWLRSHDQLDISSFVAVTGQKGSPGERLVQSLSVMPALRDFVGRKRELQRIKEAFEAKPSPMISICGMPGIGKTALAAQVVNGLKSSRNMMWYQFHEWDSMHTVLADMAGFFSMADRHQVETLLDKRDFGPGDALMAFKEDSKGMKPLLVFDDSHLAASDALAFLTLLFEAKKTGMEFDLLLVSRKELGLYDEIDKTVNNKVVEIRLEGLEEEESLAFLGGQGGWEFEAFKVTAGHPLFLVLSKSKSGPVSDSIVKDYVAKEILAPFSPEERRLAYRLAVFKTHVEYGALLGNESPAALAMLKSTGLIMEDADGRLAMHDLISNAIYDMMPFELKKEMHIWAVQYLNEARGDEPEGLLEAVDHYIRGKDFSNSAKLLVEGVWLLEDAGENGLRSVLDRLDTSRLTEEQRPQVFLAMGDLWRILRENDRALAFYRNCLNAEGLDENLEAEANARIGSVFKKTARLEESLAAYKTALAQSLRKKDKKAIARNHLSIGSVLVEMGKLDGAEEEYKSVLDLFGKKEDKAALSTAHHNLGKLAIRKREYNKARKYIEQAEVLATEHGDHLGKALASETMGILLMEMGQVSRATKRFLNALSGLKKKSYGREAEAMALRSSRALGKKEAWEEARDVLLAGLEVHSSSRGSFLSRRGVADPYLPRIYDDLAMAYRNMVDWKECHRYREMAISSYEEIGDSRGVFREKMEKGLDLEAQGEYKKSLIYLKEAEKGFEKGGDEEGYFTSLYLEAFVNENMGRYQEALKILSRMRKEMDAGNFVLEDLLRAVEESMERLGA